VIDQRLRIAALVLAAGSSRRLGQPKQLLPYGGATLLGTTLAGVRRFGFDQLIVALGGAAAGVRSTVDLTGFDVVDNVHYTSGCSSSIVSALDVIDENVDGFFLFLGDQPHVPTAAVDGLRAAARRAPLAVVRYRDGRGHPFWFHRSLFDALHDLHGDKAVWKLLESGRWPTEQVEVDADVPLDVDTWADYKLLLADRP
jgi:molybdenum cofactor cytidylyltransferase